MPKLTNEEILATFMDPYPVHGKSDWWQFWQNTEEGTSGKLPVALNLDRCRLIQDKLDTHQWEDYTEELTRVLYRGVQHLHDGKIITTTAFIRRAFIHASAEQRVLALAEVVRPFVERRYVKAD